MYIWQYLYFISQTATISASPYITERQMTISACRNLLCRLMNIIESRIDPVDKKPNPKITELKHRVPYPSYIHTGRSYSYTTFEWFYAFKKKPIQTKIGDEKRGRGKRGGGIYSLAEAISVRHNSRI